ncbi:phosphoribosylamine--glycine ligase [Candidatus Epulonipiscium fishelsonii]|uniref:Phosphoribosylamine--glycine ligase n=1 Tax=Candidatus Epulonipiscium fishelsonii TaxID=77094 RepID=A0ACC8XCY5_9FIRM|nr:phosphoribosylamine--glycine ligase [Epulopiscium sp. SCG-B11WGA-EpuloA1]ONI41831.1 phosphoribosylamine--glycine ligase [Epulopiscium sp. SCG-B05WGA-EpuloA1]
MKILVIGSGGREHAIVKKLKESKIETEIYVAPGNAGINQEAIGVDIGATDIEGVVKFSIDNKIDLVVVTPDDPLVLGMVDALEKAGIKAYGPDKKAAIIEGSKIFAKDLMKKYKIPTAEYETFDNYDKAKEYIVNYKKFPLVIKADGLALGKGVIIANDKDEALEAIEQMMIASAFGKSGHQIVLEEFLEGVEVSVLSFTDGKTIKPMVSSMDHKRALDGDLGLNTGGMGVVAPNPYYTPEVEKECMEKIFIPTIKAMNKEGRKFKGTLYFGLMISNGKPYVIEYNCRFGDPETQVCLPLLKGDLVEIFMAVIEERLDQVDLEIKDESAACVIIASGGYPKAYTKGEIISGLDQDEIIHAGTALKDNNFVTNGGRVLGICAKADTLEEALKQAYIKVTKIDFKDMHYRKDIGKKALNDKTRF